MKYIDAEKLRSVLQNTINSMKENDATGERYDAFLNGKLSICEELLGCIDSLQQEQPNKYETALEKARKWMPNVNQGGHAILIDIFPELGEGLDPRYGGRKQEQPEEELSEFEKAVGLEIFDEPFEERHIKVIKEESAKLLVLAREQFIKDGYVIEKKEFHNAVEKVATEVMKEVSDKVDMEEAISLGYEKGKAEALKDLPRWREWGNGAAGNSYGHPIALVSGAGGIRFVSVLGITGEKYIMLDDLKKLPGIKED